MKDYIVNTPLSDGYDKAGKRKLVEAGTKVSRDDDEETRSLVASGALEEIPGSSDGAEAADDKAKKAAKK